MTVAQADGNYIQPVTVDEFRIGIAETYDVIVQPHQETAYTILAQPQSCGRYARGTLAPRAGMTAEIPAMDPYPVRTMADMGMGGTAHMQGMKMDGMPSDQMPGMQGLQMDGMSGASMPAMKTMDMTGMKDGNMSAMSHTHMEEHTGASNELAGMTPFPQPGPSTTRLMRPPAQMMSRPTQTLEGEYLCALVLK